MVGHHCGHAWDADESDGLHHCECRHSADAAGFWSRFARCAMGGHDLYAHAGRSDSYCTLSDGAVWRQARLCMDAECVSARLAVVWFWLEFAFAPALPPTSRHWRRNPSATGHDLAVPGFSAGGARHCIQRDGHSPDAGSRAGASRGRLPGDDVWLAVGFLYQCSARYSWGCCRTNRTQAYEARGANALRSRGLSHGWFGERAAGLWRLDSDQWRECYWQYPVAM